VNDEAERVTLELGDGNRVNVSKEKAHAFSDAGHPNNVGVRIEIVVAPSEAENVSMKTTVNGVEIRDVRPLLLRALPSGAGDKREGRGSMIEETGWVIERAEPTTRTALAMGQFAYRFESLIDDQHPRRVREEGLR
jgi:hypothetical protein